MKRQRDELGRFVKGNTVARGNKGNRQPKYGNQNALKHGLYARTYLYYIKRLDDGSLLLNNGINPIRINKDGYKVKNDRIYIRNDVADHLKKLGYGLISD